MARLLRTIGALGLILAGCGGHDATQNRPPEAHLVAHPTSLRAGESLVLDASDSSDPDGHLIRYRFIVPDGSGELVSASPFAKITASVTGDFDLVVTVEDDMGATARATAHATVLPQPGVPCASDKDCTAGEICASGQCHRNPCGPTRPCEKPLTCTDGECLPPPATCAGPGDCPAGQTCTDGHCR